MEIINDHFDKNTVIKKNFTKWFNLKYGKELLRTTNLMLWNAFPGILHMHLANSFKKSTFETVWAKEPEVLDETCLCKFRYALNVNQWIMKDWQLVTGNFCPRSANFGKSYTINDDKKNNENIYNTLRKQKYKMMCINDGVKPENFEVEKQNLINAFEQILPEKSSFEK